MRQLSLLSVLSVVLASCGGEPATGAQGGSNASARGAAASGGGDSLAAMNAAIAELQAREEINADEVQVQHVLIAFQGSGTRATRSKAAAEKLAAEVWQRAQNGEDFLALVKESTDDSPPGIYSMVSDASKASRAQMIFHRGGMVPAFGNVGWRLQVGEIGVAPHDQKASPYGWHIVKRLK